MWWERDDRTSVGDRCTTVFGTVGLFGSPQRAASALAASSTVGSALFGFAPIFPPIVVNFADWAIADWPTSFNLTFPTKVFTCCSLKDDAPAGGRDSTHGVARLPVFVFTFLKKVPLAGGQTWGFPVLTIIMCAKIQYSHTLEKSGLAEIRNTLQQSNTQQQTGRVVVRTQNEYLLLVNKTPTICGGDCVNPRTYKK
eukprot:m.21121 g.21121  ORF g.21121 m.21121 type:complete len:197 (-) comp7040_c0_seq1:70-660(-)